MRLDIFIPYWGEPALLREAVDSVVAQSSTDWLLTIVDDAYPGDEARRYVESLRNDRVTYVRKDSNEGITANFRTCVSMATQELLVIMGSDDVLMPNFVEVVLRAHRQFPEAWIIQPGVQVINEYGQPSAPLTDIVKQKVVMPRGTHPRLVSGEPLATSLLHGDWLYWPSLVFKTDKIREFRFRDGLPVIQDLGLIIDMVLAGAKLLIEPVVCFKYRRHTGSASVVKLGDGSRFEGERHYFAIAKNLCLEKGWRRAAMAARLRITSRAHALSLLPGLLRSSPNPAILRTLIRHAVGS